MAQAQTPDKLAERLNALMRPEDDVNWTASAQGLLAAINDERSPEARVAALAYVLTEKPWAYWSGPKTPASGFPKPIDTSPGSRDRADAEAFGADRKVRQRFDALVAQLRVEEPDVIERAKRAWAFLETVPTRVGRATVLESMLRSDTFVPKDISPRELKFAEEIPDADWRAALWKHRRIIAETNGAVQAAADGGIKSEAGIAWAIDRALSRIEDERERAMVSGFVWIGMKRASGTAALLAATIGSLHDAVCGRDHGTDDEKDE